MVHQKVKGFVKVLLVWMLSISWSQTECVRNFRAVFILTTHSASPESDKEKWLNVVGLTDEKTFKTIVSLENPRL